MPLQDFSKRIMQAIADDRMKEAVQAMRELCQGSPLADEAIVQSARYNDTMRAIRTGQLTDEQADVQKTKIRYALLDMLRELDEGAAERPDLAKELAAHLSREAKAQTTITHSKNVVTGSIQAGGNVQIGDVTHGHNQQAEKIYNIQKIDKADFS